MVGERRAALGDVRVRRATHSTELLDWLGRRISALGVAVSLLLMACLAAGWRPMVGWLALRRASGLNGVTYAKAIAVVAATAGGGAAVLSGLSTTSNGPLSPVSIPAIVAGVVLVGLIIWCASTLRVGSAGVPAGPAVRRLVPGMAVVLTLVMGLGIGLIGILEEQPAEQPVAPKTTALARLAEPDPTAHPTKHVVRLRREAERADARARRAEARTATPQSAGLP